MTADEVFVAASAATVEREPDRNEAIEAVAGDGFEYDYGDEGEEEEESWSSDSEIGDVLDWLDSREAVLSGGGGVASTAASFSLAASRRPNAHGGLVSSPFQPLANRNQKFSSPIRANPLKEWEGRMDVGMSNSVTTAIRESVRGMAIGRTRNTEKVDRATFKQAE